MALIFRKKEKFLFRVRVNKKEHPFKNINRFPRVRQVVNWLMWEVFLSRMLLKEVSNFMEAEVFVFSGHIFHSEILGYF